MSNNKIFKISNIYILLCGIDWCDESIEIRGGRDYRYLASIWATNNLTDIVISAKILSLKFLSYIAENKGSGFKVSKQNRKIRIYPVLRIKGRVPGQIFYFKPTSL